jgi:hypothetical protein
MAFTNTTINDFIDKIITYNNVDEILNKCNTQSDKGFVFERLWDIIIKFGFCELFSNSKYGHLYGNVNNGKLKKFKSFNKYLQENVYSGNSGGCSDITLKNKLTGRYIFITSKYPKDSNIKSVDYYDVQNILAMIDDNKEIYTKYSIYLLVPDKISVLEKALNANKSSNYITKHIKENKILDKNDLNKYFLMFKNDIIKNKNILNYDELYLSPKDKLVLRFHQELITKKTSLLIEEGNKMFGWFCKCRSGKTYMIAGVILKQLEIKDKINVLIITPCPTETAPQFTDDLFNKFRDFNNFKVHHLEGFNSFDNIELSDNNIFVMSKQLLQNHINTETVMIIKNTKLDILVFDEVHHTGCTDKSKEIIESYSSKNTIKIFLTATYNKPLFEWDILSDCRMYWDVEDEQICKSITKDEKNIDKLIEKHGNIVNDVVNNLLLNGIAITDIFKEYLNMPDLHLITNMFDSQRYEIIKENIMGSNYGFSFDVLFSLNKNKEFNYKKEVKIILRYISGSEKEIDYKNGDKSIFSRINKICTRPCFTQIWFLPPDNINSISKNLKLLLLEDKIFKNYNIMCINRHKENDLAKDIKDEISKQEIIAKEQGKDGLILLTGTMLSLGITINSCDIVMLMNNSLSSDKIMQQMYRCMTEGNNKKMGFVVDLNISRVLHTCVNYTIYKNSKSIEDKIKYLTENHLINIDIDMLDNKKINSDGIIKKLMEIWKGDPINHFKLSLEHLKNEIIEFDNPTQQLINNHFKNSSKDDKINIKVEIKDSGDESQKIQSGKEKHKQENSEKETSDSSDDDKKEERTISFTKEVLPYIIPLTCILTIGTNNKDFVNMLNDIKINKELLNIFDDQCLIWWNKKGLVEIIENIINKYFDKNSNTFNISVQFKMSIQSLIDNPKELLELINDCLKPKQKEKQENGEVFTPMNSIYEMLDNLDKYYIEIHKTSIFSNKDLKWFDPATGMGNFMIAVYLRLMDGLKDVIKDEKLRKKHIIENMLYMSELNKKNVFITQQIFNINNEYDLKLHEGDTLELNILNKWKLGNNSFDIILGNPPYNKGGIRSHTGKQLGEKNETIWTKFIEKSFEWLKPNGYLLFINPLSWLKKSHSLHNMMLEKHIIWMKLWDNIKSLATINGKIPISLFILHNVNNDNNKKTKIISEIKSKNLTTISNEYLNPDYSVPLAYHNIFNKLMEYINKNNLKLEYNTKTVKSTGIKTKLPLDYKIEDMWAVDTYTIKDGLMVKKASYEHPDMNKRKLIISNKASFTGAFIDEGKLNLTGNHKFYIVGEKLELILKLLNFKIINIIGHYTKYGQDFLDNDAFKYLPDIRKLAINDIDENKFYKLVGFTEDEIKIITNEKINIEDNNSEKNDIVEKEEEVIKKPKKIIKKKIKSDE